MEPINLCRIVVASPGDVQAERDALPAVLEELNRGIAATQGLRLELKRPAQALNTNSYGPMPRGNSMVVRRSWSISTRELRRQSPKRRQTSGARC